MTIHRRTLPVAALLAALLPASAEAQQAWPDLANAASYTFAGNRLAFPNALVQSYSGGTFAQNNVYQVSPPYAVSNLRFLLPNFWVNGGGTADPETCTPNPITYTWVTVQVGSTYYPVSIGGSQSVRVGPCEFAWTDPLRDASGALVTLAAGTPYWVRTEMGVDAVGQYLPMNLATQVYGGREYAANGSGSAMAGTSQTAKRLGGAIGSAASKSVSGPAMAIGTGWDGSPVFLVVGDSIAAGIGDYDAGTATRGVLGFSGRGLDDAGGPGRYNYANLAIPGTQPRDQSSIAAGQFRLRMRVLRSIPNRPFNRVFSEMGQNGVLPGTTLAQHQAHMRDWWGFWRLACPTCPIYQTTYMPKTSASGNTLWTDLANQAPSGPDVAGGLRDAAITWLRGGKGLPAYVTVVDTNAAVADAAAPQKWRGLPGGWTVQGATAAGAASLVLAASSGNTTAPKVGDLLAFEPGNAANNERVIVGTVTGSGPWTITPLYNGATTPGKAHADGTAVLPMPTADGVHPSTPSHRAATGVIVAKKADGTIH